MFLVDWCTLVLADTNTFDKCHKISIFQVALATSGGHPRLNVHNRRGSVTRITKEGIFDRVQDMTTKALRHITLPFLSWSMTNITAALVNIFVFVDKRANATIGCVTSIRIKVIQSITVVSYPRSIVRLIRLRRIGIRRVHAAAPAKQQHRSRHHEKQGNSHTVSAQSSHSATHGTAGMSATIGDCRGSGSMKSGRGGRRSGDGRDIPPGAASAGSFPSGS